MRSSGQNPVLLTEGSILRRLEVTMLTITSGEEALIGLRSDTARLSASLVCTLQAVRAVSRIALREIVYIHTYIHIYR